MALSVVTNPEIVQVKCIKYSRAIMCRSLFEIEKITSVADPDSSESGSGSRVLMAKTVKNIQEDK